MLNNGTTPLIETETLEGFAAVNARESAPPSVRQTAEEIWKRAMESVVTPPTLTDVLQSSGLHSEVSAAGTLTAPAEAAPEVNVSETIRNRTGLGRLRRVTLAEVWQNDVASFAEWVQNSLDLLGEAISLPTTENSGVPTLLQNAVIECQLGESHHESLVKLLSEIAQANSKLAVWVVEKPKGEHVRVIQWLNASTSARFYLVKVDAVKIEDSVPAPFYTPIVAPGK